MRKLYLVYQINSVMDEPHTTRKDGREFLFDAFDSEEKAKEFILKTFSKASKAWDVKIPTYDELRENCPVKFYTTSYDVTTYLVYRYMEL